MEDILQQIDRLLEENRGAQAQALMEESLERALKSGDRGGAVTLLNELIGFCRETGQAEKSYGTHNSLSWPNESRPFA